MLLYGRNSVFERLKANPKSIKTVYLQENIELPHIEGLVKKNNLPSECLPFQRLSNLKPSKDLQGVVARVDDYDYIPFNDLLKQACEKQLTLIFLDRINDPHNLGVIIRIVACFGDIALVVPEYKACGINETVIHVASGGENYCLISSVVNLSTAIIKAKKSGFWIAGTVVSDDADDLGKTTLPFPLGLVLGSEGEGIRYGIEKQLDMKMRIPMHGAKLSLNVNIACAIFCNEISKQKKLLNEKKT